MNTFVPNYSRPRTIAARDSRPTWEPRPFSEGQAKLIKSMMAERSITTEQLFAEFPARPATFADGSKVINWLKAQVTPTSPPPSAQYDGLAPAPKDGKKARAWHYALQTEDGVKFYRVKRGYKPGFYFVDAQASDDFYPIRNRANREAILAEIAKDVQGALALYGQLIGRCGRCGKTLTSEYRELGIGPVCINK